MTEMIVAISLFGVLSTAAFAFLMSQNRFYDTGGRVQVAQQEARGSVRLLVNEIRRAGAGINALSASDPDILLPNDATGSRDAFTNRAITLVAVDPTNPRIPLSFGGSNGWRGRTFVLVPDTADLSGLTSGGVAYLEDSNSGNTQLLRITGVTSESGNRLRIQHASDPLDNDYPPTSSALWVAQEVRFRLTGTGAAARIERRLPGSSTWEVVSESATDLFIRYYDANGSEISPTSKTARRQIRRVDVAVTVNVPGPNGQRADFVYRAAVAPRNQTLGSS